MKSRANGYTLLEILMSTAIVIAVVGGGITAFRGFEERETLVSQGREFTGILRDVQSRASNAEKPDACGNEKLVSWRLRANSETSYYIESICENNTTILVSTNTLSPGVEFDSPSYQVDFEVLTGKASSSLVFRLTNNNNGRYDIRVNRTGLINEGSYETL